MSFKSVGTMLPMSNHPKVLESCRDNPNVVMRHGKLVNIMLHNANKGFRSQLNSVQHRKG